MIEIEETGETPESALQKILENVNLDERDVKYEVLEEGRKGLLGFGKKEARVKVSYEPADLAQKEAKNILLTILNKMNIQADAEAFEKEGRIHLDIKSEQNNRIIGRKGRTIDALQHIVNRMVNRRIDEKMILIIDAQNYRERKRDKLTSMALRMAEEAKKKNKTLTCPPYAPFDRRIIHLALQKDPLVKTVSKGDGYLRRVLISPAKQKRNRR